MSVGIFMFCVSRDLIEKLLKSGGVIMDQGDSEETKSRQVLITVDLLL